MSPCEKNAVNVIVADDDFSIRESIVKALSGSRYHVLGEASDGMNAVDLARKLRPDMALLDIEMPMMDGLSASRIIKDEGLARCTMAITSFDDVSYIDRALECGIEGYVTKPFNAQQLIASLDSCYEQSRERYMAEKERDNLKKKLSEKESTDRAKLILMESKGFTEEEAYKYLRELSKRKNLSMEKIAEFIIETEKV